MPPHTLDSTILICDDSITNTLLLEAILTGEGYNKVTRLTQPTQVTAELSSGHYDLLLLDIEMPEMDGFEVMSEIRRLGVVDELFPIVILTGRQDAETRNRALTQGAADFICKPFDETETLLRIRNALKIYAAYNLESSRSEVLEQLVEQRTQELSKAADVFIARLARAGELKDDDTGKHVLRVGKYAHHLAKLLGLPPHICFMIEKAAPLHDLGKIGIADDILLKPSKLTEAERDIMNRHTYIGANLLDDHDSLLVQMAAAIALSHHEWWDGSGYPKGLSGEAIPIEGRITAICDVFDALTSERPYKHAWTTTAALAEIQRLSAKQFDPQLVQLFSENIGKILELQASYSDGPHSAAAEHCIHDLPLHDLSQPQADFPTMVTQRAGMSGYAGQPPASASRGT